MPLFDSPSVSEREDRAVPIGRRKGNSRSLRLGSVPSTHPPEALAVLEELSLESQVQQFLQDYGDALGRGDLDAVVSRWEVPAFVLSDEGAIAVARESEVREFFRRAVEWYHSQGMLATQPAEMRVEALSERLVRVDVVWSATDGAGAERLRERSQYLLLRGEDDQLRIRVTLSLPVS